MDRRDFHILIFVHPGPAAFRETLQRGNKGENFFAEAHVTTSVENAFCYLLSFAFKSPEGGFRGLKLGATFF
jgi:hypothetical protein